MNFCAIFQRNIFSVMDQDLDLEVCAYCNQISSCNKIAVLVDPSLDCIENNVTVPSSGHISDQKGI